MKTYIDVIYRDRFYGQIEFIYHPVFVITITEIKVEIEKKYPTLKNKKYNIYFTEKKVWR